MNWKKYEKEIFNYFRETYPEANISFDQKVLGKYSKVLRQIDILIEGEIAGFPVKIAVDCKCFSKNIDVKQVESFCSMVEDVGAHQGVLITQKGYSQASINRAHYGNQQVELDIINFSELTDLQTLSALPYIEQFCVIIRAPFGWVLNFDDQINSFPTLHQRGVTLKKAQKKNEWMYMQFWKKDDSEFDTDKLIKLQNLYILDFRENSTFTYKTTAKRSDGIKTKIRIAEIPEYPASEVTGFIEFENYIFFVVLFTPKELLSKNIRKLQHILKETTPSKIQFENSKLIQENSRAIAKSKDNKEKADKYYQIGKWQKEMLEFKNSFQSYKKGIKCFPTHYIYLKNIIREALEQELYDEAKEYSMQLFEIDPKNPTVPQDLIEIYLTNKRQDLLIEFFLARINHHKENETLGNLTFHLGLTYHELEKQEDANKYMTKAKIHFTNIFPPEHYIFKAMEELKNESKNRNKN